jgi:hypothetical protein
MDRRAAVGWPTVRALLIGSMPAAFVGGRIQLPSRAYLPLLGALLLLAAVRLWLPERAGSRRSLPALGWLVVLGAGLGFLAGLTGIGGGVFLTPILILTGWEVPRRTAGAAVVFILVNSIAGFVGHLSLGRPPRAPTGGHPCRPRGERCASGNVDRSPSSERARSPKSQRGGARDQRRETSPGSTRTLGPESSRASRERRGRRRRVA